MKIMVNGAQFDEGLKVAQAVYQRNPAQLIRHSFLSNDYDDEGMPQGAPYYYPIVGTINGHSSGIWTIERVLTELLKSEGEFVAVNVCHLLTGQTQHALPYLELKIPFILSSAAYECRYPRNELEYIETEVLEQKGLAIIGQPQETRKWFPVTSKAIDFLIEQAAKKATGLHKLEDFQ